LNTLAWDKRFQKPTGLFETGLSGRGGGRSSTFCRIDQRNQRHLAASKVSLAFLGGVLSGFSAGVGGGGGRLALQKQVCPLFPRLPEGSGIRVAIFMLGLALVSAAVPGVAKDSPLLSGVYAGEIWVQSRRLTQQWD